MQAIPLFSFHLPFKVLECWTRKENYKKLDYLDDERSILGEKIYFRESFKGLWLKYEKKNRHKL